MKVHHRRECMCDRSEKLKWPLRIFCLSCAFLLSVGGRLYMTQQWVNTTKHLGLKQPSISSFTSQWLGLTLFDIYSRAYATRSSLGCL